jgi:hypothetical protein
MDRPEAPVSFVPILVYPRIRLQCLLLCLSFTFPIRSLSGLGRES